ncbi:MAG: hypothetical protein NTW19_02120 [Planctomycetota bacterium]|nr:hypothetical protein [Planctomycetota bacterium]
MKPIFLRGLSLAFAFALTTGLTTASAAEPKTMTIRDFTGRGFAPDVVSYETSYSPSDAKRLRIMTTNNTPVALQISPDKDKDGKRTLSFIAEVAPNGVSEYTLTDDGKAPAVESKFHIAEEEGDAMTLSNGLFAVRMPKPVEKKYNTPIPAEKLPAPILGFRSGSDGPLLGSSRLLSKRLVKAWRVSMLTTGPVFIDVRYEIEWAEGGYFRGTYRIADQVPIVTATEEHDLGKMVPEADTWELTLTQGWSPDMAEVAKTWGNGGVEGGSVVPIDISKMKGADGNPLVDSRHVSATGILKFDPIQPSGAYGDMSSQLGLHVDAQAKADPAKYPLVGVVPLHQGSWRRTATLDLLSPDAGKTINVRFPLMRQPPVWVETSPFVVVTHEQELPYTYARRVWGLVLAHPPLKVIAGDTNTPLNPCYAARVLYGTVGLDRYKDYILDWPDKGTKYPRVYFRAEELDKIKAALDTHPNAAELKKSFYSLTGDEAMAKANAETRNWIDGCISILTTVPTPSHHRVYEGPRAIARAEDALSFPGLDPKVRTRLRAKLATLAYLMTDADCMGSGNGAHTGNPNMSIARQMWAASLVATLPDHPMYEPWKAFYAAYAEHKFADNMAPGGGWFEFGGYHMWGYARLIEAMFGLETMKVPNLDRLFAYDKADLDYFLNLLTAVDPRHGARMIPGFGNSSIQYNEQFMAGAGSLAQRDPEQAGNLVWAWQNNGKQTGYITGAARPYIQPVEPKLTSRIFPGFGVIFRAHQGPDETYMAFRSGFLWSHWYVDQNEIILNSKGAVLLPSQPYAYYTSANTDFSQYNDLRFGHPANEYHYSWPDSNILDAELKSQRVQYAWSSSGYPAWYISPGRVPRFGPPPKLLEGVEQKQGDFVWDRQIAFMVGPTPKSPNYFVIHDSLSGEGKLAHWFNLNLLGRKANVKAEGERIALDTEFPTKFDLLFPGQPPKGIEMAEDDSQMNLLPHRDAAAMAAALNGAPLSPNWRRKDGKPIDLAKAITPDIENHVLVRIPGTPGEGHFWVAYPRGQGEGQPQSTRLGPDAVKVKHDAGTDYVLLAPHGGKYVGEDVTLDGSAVAVRLGADEVTLAIMGGAGKVAYKGHSIEGVAPIEKTVKLSEPEGVAKVAPPSDSLIEHRPQLKNHAETAVPGVKKAVDGDRSEYIVVSDRPVNFDDGRVRIEGRQAVVYVAKESVRFVALEPTYVKLVVGKQAIRGVGPFDLTFTADSVTGTVAGKTRSLALTRPEKIIRPMFHLDGVRWYAGFSDDTAPYRGRDDVQFAMAFGTTEGKHKVEIREWASPILPPLPPRAAVGK